MNNNVILGVPKPVDYGFPPHTATGVDCDGNEFEFSADDINTFVGNYDKTSEGYADIKPMTKEYQEKGMNASFDFRTLMQ